VVADVYVTMVKVAVKRLSSRGMVHFMGLAILAAIAALWGQVSIGKGALPRNAPQIQPETLQRRPAVHASRRTASSVGKVASSNEDDTNTVDTTANDDETQLLSHWPGPTKPKLRAFYNVFIPPSENNTVSEVVVDLIFEQLTQIATSYAAKAYDIVIHVIASGQAVNDAWLQSLCTSVTTYTNHTEDTFQCVLVAQYSQGNEMETLAKVHDYCLENTNELVLYFHNKGSFHPSVENDNFRRSLTAATSSKHCLTKMTSPSKDACDACGLLLYPLPQPIFIGNMWVARCSYVAKLLAPLSEYRTAYQAVDRWIYRDQIRKKVWTTDSNIFPFQDWTFGRGRFESEHWLCGHPSLRPCDVATDANVNHWRPDTGNWTDFGPYSSRRFAWSMAPRFSITNPGWYWQNYHFVKDDEFRRKCDYFLLRGHLYKWMVYYNSTAPANSWVWKFFPDGDYWRSLVESIGPLPATHERHCQDQSVGARVTRSIQSIRRVLSKVLK
jgi:hypothetical protein